MRTLKILWNYAEQCDVPDLPPNPLQKLKKRWYAIPERERYVIPQRERYVSGDQLPAFDRAATNLPSRTMRDYLLVVLFTGLRKNAAAGLRWADIDFSQRIIRLPAWRTN